MADNLANQQQKLTSTKETKNPAVARMNQILSERQRPTAGPVAARVTY